MPEPTLTELKLREYRQRRRLDSLRQQLYSKEDPAEETRISGALNEAEMKLREIEEARQKMEGSSKAEHDGGVLLSNEPGEVSKPAGILLGAESTGIETKVLLRMSRVPTGVVHLLDAKETPLVSFKVTNRKDDILRVRLTSCIEGFSAKAIDTVEIEAHAEPVTIDQLPTFFPDRLASVNELTRATLNICIDDLDGKTEKESTFPIWLMARTSAFNSIYDPAKDEWKDISHYYGAWVTPNVPEVMQILRRASDFHPEKSIAGYQVDTAGVKEQVKAIYRALQAEQIMYIHSVVNFGATDEQNMQRVRLPRESLAHKSANCIDGTCLMASVLEAASINPGFVFVPGHAFLAWETQEESDQWDYVETTMISTHDFEAANKEGRRQAKEQQAAFKTSKDINDYLQYSLAELRALRGIYPME